MFNFIKLQGHNETNDTRTLGQLVSKIKGTKNIRQFSDEIGINISTLSRIMNDKMARPLSRDVLNRIIKVVGQDNPLADKLIAANENVGCKFPLDDIDMDDEVEKENKYLIRNILLDNFCGVAWSVNFSYIDYSSTYTCYDLLATVYASDTNIDVPIEWGFIFCSQQDTIRRMNELIAHVILGKLQDENISECDLLGISLVFLDRKLFDKYVNEFSKMQTEHITISIIYINSVSGTVGEEYVLMNRERKRGVGIIEIMQARV